jgi:hypothetical protein
MRSAKQGEWMRRCHLPHGPAGLAILLGMLCACTPTHYQNVNHPNYGDNEYSTDLAQCRRDNSTVVTHQGYDVQTEVQVDEAKVAACMTTRGWQKASK